MLCLLTLMALVRACVFDTRAPCLLCLRRRLLLP
jgi:hypothetical protein